MPSKKRKYNARFPAGRIKKIMQTDEDVGKVAQAVPIIISRTLELFAHSLLTKTVQVTNSRNAKTLSPSHLKQCILSESRFDFLKDLVKGLPDVSAPDDDVPSPPMTPLTIVCPPMTPDPAPIKPTVKNSETETSNAGSAKPTVARRRSKDKKEKRIPSMSLSETKSTPVLSNMSEFTPPVPSVFNAIKPNFYTEVNPSSEASTDRTVHSYSGFAMSNFSHTTNIDEDYDT